MNTNILNKFRNYTEYKQNLIFKLKYGTSSNTESVGQAYRRIVKEKSYEMKQAQTIVKAQTTQKKETTEIIKPIDKSEETEISVRDIKSKIFQFANIIVETPEEKPEPKEERKSTLIVEEITLANRVSI